MKGKWAIILAVAFGFMTCGINAQITLDQNFECGALDVASTTISNPSSGTPVVTLVPRYNGGQFPQGWWWLYFSATGVANKTPTFQASTVGNSIPFDNNTRWVYSYDQTNWLYFTSGIASNGLFIFSNNTAFASNTVFVATAIPYGPSQAAALITSIKTNPYVLPTKTADTNLVVGRTLGTAGGGYTDDLGRPVAAQNLYGFAVTDPSIIGPKTRIVFMSGNHSGEPAGTMTLQGVVTNLLSSDPLMQQLRQHVVFYFYPLVDPEGRAAGYYVSTPQNPNKNHNRFWNNPAGFTDITTIENAMRTDTGGQVDYFFDFHAQWQPDQVELLAPVTLYNSKYVQMLVARDSTIVINPYFYDVSGYAMGWAGSAPGLNAPDTSTLEMGTLAGAQQSTYDHYGQDFLLAFYDLLVAGAPTGLTATAGDGRVSLAWTGVPGATSYNVKRSAASDQSPLVIASAVTNGYTDATVTNGATYYYLLSALTANGESGNSLPARATPLTAFAQWQLRWFGCTDCPQAAAGADPDGDGRSNLEEYLAGTNPTNSSSTLRILAVQPESNAVRITWQTVAGTTNIVQAADNLGGSYSNLSPNLIPAGTGDIVTNYLDVIGTTNLPSKFYRIELTH